MQCLDAPDIVPDVEMDPNIQCRIKSSIVKGMVYSGQSNCTTGNIGMAFGNYNFSYNIISNTEFPSKGKKYEWCFNNAADLIKAQIANKKMGKQ